MPLKSIPAQVKTFFTTTLWEIDTLTLSRWRRFALYLARIGAVMVQGYQKNRLPIRATALAYTTLLSIVPFLAVAFSLFQAFGGLDKSMEPIQRFILSNLTTGTGSDAVNYLNQFIENFRGGVVGLIGFVLLILSVVGLLSSVESAFNDIWGIASSRAFIRRFTTYWTLISIGPVFLGTSLSVTGALQSNQLVTQILSLSGGEKFLIGKIPWLITWGMFTALYLIMPNSRVKFRSALLGGIVGGTFWEIAKYGYTIYATQVVSHYKVYGSLGMVPIFLIWIYYTWLAVLLGAQLTYADQHVSGLKSKGKPS